MYSLHSKPRPIGLPELGQRMPSNLEPGALTKSGYRLPKLKPGRAMVSASRDHEDDFMEESYYGTREFQPQLELGVRHLGPEQAYLYQRRTKMAAPHFRSAIIAPVTQHGANEEYIDLLWYRRFGAFTSRPFYDVEQREGAPYGRHALTQQTYRPAPSPESPYRLRPLPAQQKAEASPRLPVHGPFSREFTVTCLAPENWRRMKWGRSKTLLQF